jgi:hypothetical protein
VTKVYVIVEIEFATNNEFAARATLIRLPGEIAHGIQHGATGLTGVKPGSVQIKNIREEMTDDDEGRKPFWFAFQHRRRAKWIGKV